VSQELFDWLLLIGRWVHITVAVTWIGTSIFFMWMDRTFKKNPESKRPGHVGDMWMIHGGGFYHVEKLMMGPTKVPKELHWFKWESYWTWMSGMFLLVLIFYTGGGTFLLDESISSLTYAQGVGLSLFSIFGSWFVYDFLWEQPSMKTYPKFGHFLTMSYFAGMTYLLCNTLAGRAAYIHIGAMLGTWMAANVFMRIIPRQVKMVEATEKGEPVNPDWGINAKNRSTHNTYFTLPVIFIMLSNHFPMTYGHDLNWLILILIAASGAAVREYFVVRLSNPKRSYKMAAAGIIIMLLVTAITKEQEYDPSEHEATHTEVEQIEKPQVKADVEEPKIAETSVSGVKVPVMGKVYLKGDVPAGKKLRMPGACTKGLKQAPRSDEIKSTNGKLENAIVYIKNAEKLPVGPMMRGEARSSEVEIDQKNCIYRPRVSAAQTGQRVVFINSDAIVHNVKVNSKKNPKFNVTMPKQGQRVTKTFRNPEFVILAKCSLHPWMSGFLTVFDHPYYAVTNSKGEFQLPSLPIGKYTIEVWHETLGKQTTAFEIFPGDTKFNMNFTYNL
jgi:uncharacterized membrane protein/plastocyanin